MAELLKLSWLIPVFALLGGLTGCLSVKPIYYKDDKAVAVRYVDNYRSLYNDERFEEMYALLSKRVQQEVAKEEFVSQMQKAKQSNGKFLNAHEIKSEVVPVGSAREVRIMYESEFELGPCSEGYAILVDGNNAIIDAAFFNPISARSPSPQR